MLAKQCVEAIENTHRELFATLKEHFDVHSMMHQDVDFAHLDGYSIIFVATGGTEGLIVKDYERLFPVFQERKRN